MMVIAVLMEDIVVMEDVAQNVLMVVAVLLGQVVVEDIAVTLLTLSVATAKATGMDAMLHDIRVMRRFLS